MHNTYFPWVSRISTSYLDPPLWVALIGSFQFPVKSPTNNTSSPCNKSSFLRQTIKTNNLLMKSGHNGKGLNGSNSLLQVAQAQSHFKWDNHSTVSSSSKTDHILETNKVDLHLKNVNYLLSIPYKGHSMCRWSIMFAIFHHSYKIPCCPSNCWSAVR